MNTKTQNEKKGRAHSPPNLPYLRWPPSTLPKKLHHVWLKSTLPAILDFVSYLKNLLYNQKLLVTTTKKKQKICFCWTLCFSSPPTHSLLHIWNTPSFNPFHWCCFYYFVRNSLVALLEALCARIFSFRFVNIGFFLTYFLFVCVQGL